MIGRRRSLQAASVASRRDWPDSRWILANFYQPSQADANHYAAHIKAAPESSGSSLATFFAAGDVIDRTRSH